MRDEPIDPALRPGPAAASSRWRRRPPGSNWGAFGADDELGRMNLLTPERVRAAVAEVREGLTFCLSLPLDHPGGSVLNERRRPPVLRPTIRSGRPNYNFPFELEEDGLTDVTCDDVVDLTLQYSTQWDGFAHVGSRFDADGDGVPETVFYNGFRAGVDVVGPAEGSPGTITGDACYARRLDVASMAATGVQGRGVLVDLEHHLGRGRTRVDHEQLIRVLEADRVIVEEGDLLVVHTGFGAVLLEMGRAPARDRLDAACAVLDGRDARLLRWIDETGMVAVIADNYGVEEIPARRIEGPRAAMPLHEHCLFKLGIHLGELWYTSELAAWLRAHGRSRFLLTAPPLRLPGAVGSPVTPVATV